jgi:hypothetical protein
MTEIYEKTLMNFTTESLKKELLRRENIKARKPKPVNNPDFKQLISICISYMDVDDPNDLRVDIQSDIYEEAISAVFGEKVWGWINER